MEDVGHVVHGLITTVRSSELDVCEMRNNFLDEQRILTT
jgi:hypothetical protein